METDKKTLEEDTNALYEYIQEADDAFENGDFAKAMIKYVIAGGIYPSVSFYCNYRLGWISELKGKFDSALRSYEKGIAENEEYAYLYLMKGILLKKHFGKMEEAEDCFRKCLELEEGKIEEGVCWHHACAELGQHKKAVEAMNRMLEAFPNEAGLYFDAACMYCTLHEYDQALQYLDTCLDMGYHLQHVLFDSYLDAIRDTERYKEIISKHTC